MLDFSSGSEMDEKEWGPKKKVSNLTSVDKKGNATTSPSRTSLLEFGFSKHLERVKEQPESGEGDSSTAIEESSSEEDEEDKKRKGTLSDFCKSSNAGGEVMKMGKKMWEISSNSDGEDGDGNQEGQKRVSLFKQGDDTARRKQDLKERTDKKASVYAEGGGKKMHNKLKTTLPGVNYSDESEDLEVETVKGPKSAALNSHTKEGDQENGRVDRSRKRQSVSARDKARFKYTENIETFTSSEDECPPVKKGRSQKHSFRSPPTERPRAEPQEYEQRAETSNKMERKVEAPKAVSFTNLKSQTSQERNEKDGTIDSVLG